MCNTYAVDDAPHFLFVCEASHAKLNQFWDAMSHVAPERLMCEMRGMSATERTKCFLSRVLIVNIWMNGVMFTKSYVYLYVIYMMYIYMWSIWCKNE